MSTGVFGNGPVITAVPIEPTPSRPGSRFTVVSARRFGVHVCSADFMVTAYKWRTPL